MADDRLGGTFLGNLPPEHPYNAPWEPVHEAVHPKTFEGMSPQDYMKTRPEGEEGFFSPGSELLWIRKPQTKQEDLISSFDPVGKQYG